MRTLGFIFCISVYLILLVHVYAYFSVIAGVVKRRLGVAFGLVWISIGFALLYNIIWNHFWSMMIKPGSPRDLVQNEKIRKDVKNRENRKAAKVAIGLTEGGNPREGTQFSVESEDDRFEGLQKDVKRLMKYRTKTMGNLEGLWSVKCPECNELKPARTHHCSVTGECVF